MVVRTHAMYVHIIFVHSIYFTTDIGLIFSGFLLLLVHNIKERAYGINNQVDKRGNKNVHEEKHKIILNKYKTYFSAVHCSRRQNRFTEYRFIFS